jgi:hypothetical protein
MQAEGSAVCRARHPARSWASRCRRFVTRVFSEKFC